MGSLLKITADEVGPRTHAEMVARHSAAVRRCVGAGIAEHGLARTNKRSIMDVGIEAWREARIAQRLKATQEEKEAQRQIERVRSDVLSMRRPHEEIIANVADKHGVTSAEIKGSSQVRKIVRARQEAMWVLHFSTDFSMPKIGQALGGRDHTTVLHGINVHADRNGVARRKPGSRGIQGQIHA